MASYKQGFLKSAYPLLMKVSKLFGKNAQVIKNEGGLQPVVSLHELHITLSNGHAYKMEEAKGKKILIVNTASACGYTAQYAALQNLQESFNEQLVVIGFPSNDFKEQEKGNDEEIAKFCTTAFGVRFPLAKKSVVIKAAEQNAVYKWLSDSTENGWNNQQPVWNFSKYLVDENGVLTHFFGPSIDPLSKEVLAAIQE